MGTKIRLYTKRDQERLFTEIHKQRLDQELYRTEWRRDYSRLIHSSSFRRLQGKTQLYPSRESDFFRNRLTHSLEVAQIAKSLGARLNYEILKNYGPKATLNLDIIEIAALAHDIGHPPFGHQGEEALDECMYDYGGFEGNAQTLRIVTRLEKKFYAPILERDFGNVENRIGLNLTARSIASILKYDKLIPDSKMARQEFGKKYNQKQINSTTLNYGPIKGYYTSEKNVVESLKTKIIGSSTSNTKLKTIECQIMDIADDIAYSTYDMEDALKAGFYSPYDILIENRILEKVAEKVSSSLDSAITMQEVQDILISEIFTDIFPPEIDIQKGLDLPQSAIVTAMAGHSYGLAKKYSFNAYHRTQLTSYLVGKFVRGVKLELNNDNPMLSKVYLEPSIRKQVEILKTFNYESQILSPRLKVAEYRGKEIVKQIFSKIVDSEGKLLPTDHKDLYDKAQGNLKFRIVSDFIAGMTDRYCIEYFGRLTSENPETIFKPF